MSRALLLFALALGCAVPELDRAGAIVCGSNNLCPVGFTCALGRCCPVDAGASCPTLPRACVGSSTTTFSGAPPASCVAAQSLYNQCTPRGAATCGALECSPITSVCFPAPTTHVACRTAANIGNDCWEGRGICVGAVQLGYDPMTLLGLSIVCIPKCSYPQGQAQAQCGDRSVCLRLSGLVSPVCAPDCRAIPCGTGSTCDRATGSCRQ